MMRCTVVLSCFIIFFSGCIQQKQSHKFSDTTSAQLDSVNDSVFQPSTVVVSESQYDTTDVALKAAALESTFGDIPIPLGAKPIPEYVMTQSSCNMGTMLGYVSSSTNQKLYDFFMHECIRLGWRCCAQIRHIETLLCFEKPDCHCTVSIRPCDNGDNAIIISISQMS